MSKKKTVFETEWFSIESEDFDDLPALAGKPFYRMNIPDSAVMLAQNSKHQIVFVRQFRPAVNQFVVELPAGVIDPGENPKEAAMRELYEETGYRVKKCHFIHASRAMTDRVNSQINLFYGEGAEKDAHFTPEPGVEVVLATLEELKNFTLDGTFINFASLGVLLWAKWKIDPEGLSDLAF